MTLKAQKLLEFFTENNYKKKQIKESLELKHYCREKTITYMVNRKATIVLLTVGLIKTT